MARMSGEDTCRDLRERGFTAVPIIAATGNASEVDMARYREAGFTDIIVKPFSARQLAEVLLRCGVT